ncbi:M48 family metallopeptidase [Streptomyces sp. NPDC001910]|uniref:M48 family metallopeptidase n=1 Tax=Streptomyces sp. NPDC001910 TaxID=3154403 RepID=UPI00331DD86C
MGLAISGVAVVLVLVGTVIGLVTGPASRRWLASAGAYVIAAAVLLGVAGLVTTGAFLILQGWSSVLQPTAGVVLLVCAVYVWPRPGKLRPGQPALGREQAPELFALVDHIADAAGAGHVDMVQLSTDFSVRVAAVGAGRRRVLFLGYPLWAVHGHRQRVAAIAYALVYQAHDIRNTPLIDSARAVLRRVSWLSGRPPESDAAADQLLKPSALSRYGDELSTAAGQFSSRTRIADWTLLTPALIARGTDRILLTAARPATLDARRRAETAAAGLGSPPGAAFPDPRLAREVAAEMHRLTITAQTFRNGRSKLDAADNYWDKLALFTQAERLGHGMPLASDSTPGVPLPVGRVTADAIEDELRAPSRLLAEAMIQGG